MSINLSNKQAAVAILCAVAVVFGVFFLGKAAHNEPEPVVEVVETVKYVEVIPEEVFDTSILEKWDGDFTSGKIRMIGAWLYGQDTNGNPIIIDEANEFWTIGGYNVSEEDFLLLWISDNNTPSYVHDDLILKIWTEKYENVVYEEVG